MRCCGKRKEDVLVVVALLVKERSKGRNLQSVECIKSEHSEQSTQLFGRSKWRKDHTLHALNLELVKASRGSPGMLKCQEASLGSRNGARAGFPAPLASVERKVCQRVSFVLRGGVWAAVVLVLPRASQRPPSVEGVPAWQAAVGQKDPAAGGAPRARVRREKPSRDGY